MEFTIFIDQPLLSALLTLSLAANIGFAVRIVYNKVTNSHQVASKLDHSNPVQFGSGSSGNTVIQQIISKEPETYKEVSDEMEEKSEALQEGKIDFTQYFSEFESKVEGKWEEAKTGYKDVDSIIGSLKSSQLIVLAALPSEGRTTLVTDITRYNAIQRNLPVFMFTMGAKAQAITDRLLSAEATVDHIKLTRGKLHTESEYEQLRHAMERLSKAPIFIDGVIHSKVQEMRSIIKKAVDAAKAGVVVIDGIELLADYQKNKASTLTELKKMAVEFDVPVIITAPFPEDPTARRGGSARVTDLPESFNQIADVVIGLDPRYRWIEPEESNIRSVTVLKNRDGLCGKAELYHDETHLKFLSIEKSDFSDAFST